MAIRRLTALSVLALLAVAACGGSSKKSSSTTALTPASSTPAASAPTSSSGGGSSLTVTEMEYKLTPANPTVSAGTVQVKIDNTGTVTHALEIAAQGPAATTCAAQTSSRARPPHSPPTSSRARRIHGSARWTVTGAWG